MVLAGVRTEYTENVSVAGTESELIKSYGHNYSPERGGGGGFASAEFVTTTDRPNQFSVNFSSGTASGFRQAPVRIPLAHGHVFPNGWKNEAVL